MGPLTEGLVVRPSEAEDEAEILSVMRLALGGTSFSTPKIPAFRHWKHFQNPFGSSYTICACNPKTGEIVGVRSLMRWEFRTPSGERIRAARAVDASTHPNYRRRGIFTTLTTRAIKDLTGENCAFIYNTPKVGGQSLPGYLRMGWVVVTHWPLYFRIFRPARFAAGIVSGRSSEQTQPDWETIFEPEVAPWADFYSVNSGELDEVIGESERSRNPLGYRTPRSAAYLHWRYGGHPTVVYGVIPYFRNHTLLGFAIVRPNIRNGLKEVVLTELIAPDLNVRQAILQRIAEATHADYVVCHFQEQSPEYRSVRSARFRRGPGRGVTFTIRRLGTFYLDPSTKESWDLSLGDLEIF
jgi:hypothetical protein